jgi:hypothetical protein
MIPRIIHVMPYTARPKPRLARVPIIEAKPQRLTKAYGARARHTNIAYGASKYAAVGPDVSLTLARVAGVVVVQCTICPTVLQGQWIPRVGSGRCGRRRSLVLFCPGYRLYIGCNELSALMGVNGRYNVHKMAEALKHEITRPGMLCDFSMFPVKNEDDHSSISSG